MTAAQVIDFYIGVRDSGVRVWIDGGWCVDALLGEEGREHADLDIAVGRSDDAALRDWFVRHGFSERPDGNEFAYVMQAPDGRRIDVHCFEYGPSRENVWGIPYPWGSLSGLGEIGGQRVECVAAEWMFRFKTAYAPVQKDLADVERLARRFGFEVPESHRGR